MLNDEEVQRHCRNIAAACLPLDAMIEARSLPETLHDQLSDALDRIEAELELMGYDDEAGAAQLLQELESEDDK
jgi:hypothetical protein